MLPDVILLDVMLPGLDGLKVCQQLRAGDRTHTIPVIMITAKSEENDQVVGYAMGADDYVTKPFSNKILLQKVKALLRRNAQEPVERSDVVDYLGVKLDRVRHRVTCHGAALDLTPTEFKLLECLLRQPGRAFTRHQLMDAADRRRGRGAGTHHRCARQDAAQETGRSREERKRIDRDGARRRLPLQGGDARGGLMLPPVLK